VDRRKLEVRLPFDVSQCRFGFWAASSDYDARAHYSHVIEVSPLATPLLVDPSGSSLGGAMWQPIETAPFDSELELAVIASTGTHALVFPCRRILDGWINALTERRFDLQPTHWRPWTEAASGALIRLVG
jgi:hypothetical protein